MKKKILGLVACLGIALFFAINVSINLSKDHSTSGLALKNIEALAQGEVPGGITGSKDAYANSYYDEKGWHVDVKSVSPCWCIGYDHRKPIGNVICQCTN